MIDQAQAQAEQKFEERLKALEADREEQIKVVEDRLTKKFDDEVLASEAAAALKPEYKELLKNQEVQTQQQEIQR